MKSYQLFPLLFLSLLLGACQTSRYVKYNQETKFAVTLPEIQDAKVTLAVSVGEIKDVEGAPGNSSRKLVFDPTGGVEEKFTICPPKVTIMPGEKEGFVHITLTDDGYKGHHFLILFEGKNPSKPNEPFLGVTSMTIEPGTADKVLRIDVPGSHTPIPPQRRR